MPALDELVRRRRITGYTVERDAAYLEADRPTLTYRMYKDRSGTVNANHFISDMTGIGASVTLGATAGNIRSAGGIRRTAQMTVTARFGSKRELVMALAVVRARYHALGDNPVPGSWWLPDVRVAGCEELGGTIPVIAQSVRTRRGTAVALTLSSGRLLPGARIGRVRVLGEWIKMLSSHTIVPLEVAGCPS